jgi:hypothetical protein
MDNAYTFLVLLVIFLACWSYITYSKKKINEKFEDVDLNKETKVISSVLENTPSENGLVFGYLPQVLEETKKTQLDPNVITSDSNIIFNTKNLYLGMSDKNPMLPVFLEKVGTFTPYEYEVITILAKSDSNIPNEPILYNKTTIYFTIQYLRENYYLQYIPNTSTFYLSKTPSYFILKNSIDINSNKEAKYGDSILIQCLDNSEYLFEYESFLITEPNKSSTFYFNRSEIIDICVDFKKDKSRYLKQFLNNNEAQNIHNKAKVEIDNYINKLRGENAKSIKELELQIEILEKKKSNLVMKNNIGVEKGKSEYDNKIRMERDKIDVELKNYQSQLEKEYNTFKNDLTTTRGAYWTNEINKLKKEICK